MKVYLMHITSENLDCCIVTLFVHNVCNYRCSYCDDYHRDGSDRWRDDWRPYFELIERIKTYMEHYDEYLPIVRQQVKKLQAEFFSGNKLYGAISSER